MSSDSIPLSDESTNRGLVCAHLFHGMDAKDPDIHVLGGECWQQKHIRHAPSMKME